MLFVRPSKMMFGPTKGGKLNFITYNIYWANQKTESFVYRWLRAHAMLYIAGFLTFLRESNVNTSITAMYMI